MNDMAARKICNESHSKSSINYIFSKRPSNVIDYRQKVSQRCLIEARLDESQSLSAMHDEGQGASLMGRGLVPVARLHSHGHLQTLR